MRSGLYMVRPAEPETTDAEGVTTGGGPELPEGWQSRPESGGWWTLQSPDGEVLHAYRMALATDDSAYVWMVMGTRAQLDALAKSANYAAPLHTAWEQSHSDMDRWPVWRVSGSEYATDEDGTRRELPLNDDVRRIVPADVTLPDLPPQANATIYVRPDGSTTSRASEARFAISGRSGPAFDRTIAGYRDHLDAEQTE